MKSLEALLDNPAVLANALSMFRDAGESEQYFVTDRWALNLYDFSGELVVHTKQGKEHRLCIHPGCAAILPPVNRSFRIARPGHHWIALFHLPATPELLPAKPLLINCAPQFRELERQFEEAITRQHRQKRHAEALLWQMLWAVCDATREKSEATQRHPGLQAATVYLRDHLADSPALAAVADAAGISHNHLNRLCREYYGCTIGEYLHSRRMELARHLLCDTTMPIKQIAQRTGLPDLQQFNKTIRRHFGCSPTMLRMHTATSPTPATSTQKNRIVKNGKIRKA